MYFRHDDEKMLVKIIHPFAWVNWPMDLIAIGIAELKAAISFVTTGESLVVRRNCVTESVRKAGRRSEVVRTSRLSPIVTIQRFERREDYEKSKI